MHSGLDLAAMDRSVRPQDDLFGFVNGSWLATTEIPHDRARFGAFDMLVDKARDDVKVLLEEAREQTCGRASTDAPDDDDVRAKVGGLYASFLDEERVAELGLAPIRADLDAVEAVDSVEELFDLLGRLQRDGVGGAIEFYVNNDNGNSAEYIVYLTQGGIGLPDESYYREEKYDDLRSAYRDHVERLAALTATDGALAAVEVEQRLARSHWDRVATRDAVASYNRMTQDELTTLAPHVPWHRWFEALGVPAERVRSVIVRQPSFLKGLSAALVEVPLEDWKAWLRRRIVSAFSAYLDESIVEESFDFYGRVLTGTTEIRARWKRGVDLVNGFMGEATGQLYVERHFPPEAKERMLALVDNLIEAYRRDIEDLTWMSATTKEKALAKLATFVPKIGYPDEWRDYRPLRIDAGDLLGNVRRSARFEVDRQWGKLGGPVDRGEWFMAPQTVNAYYNPSMNEIVFPAAILQPPFFDVEADDAVNYGAIGSVIGHEIGHGFDDQGSRYDGEGNLVDWWTAADREAFDRLSGRLIAQYDAFEPRDLPGERVNGALTVGENIGDLGGVTVAHLAYRLSLGEGGLASAPVIDGLTGEQRFFAGWAQVWRLKARPEEAKRLLAIDPHAPGEFRANIVRNLAEFHDAFDVTDSDRLWLPKKERIRIW